MAKILLYLTALQEARWEKNPETGVEILIAPLAGDRDAEMQNECTDMMGNISSALFGEKVALECIKGWKGLGAVKGEEAPCNPENVKAFAKKFATSLMPWVIRRARSLDHYREQELEQAKNA